MPAYRSPLGRIYRIPCEDRRYRAVRAAKVFIVQSLILIFDSEKRVVDHSTSSSLSFVYATFSSKHNSTFRTVFYKLFAVEIVVVRLGFHSFLNLRDGLISTEDNTVHIILAIQELMPFRALSTSSSACLVRSSSTARPVN